MPDYTGCQIIKLPPLFEIDCNVGLLSETIQYYMLDKLHAFVVNIKTHDSESRGQEEPATTE